jgi:hypothetical protein
MTFRGEARQRAFAREAFPTSPSEYAAQLEAKRGSQALLNHCLRSGSTPTETPARPLTFEEQLAAVERGARLVTVLPIHRAEPSITLGGVSPW